MAVAGPSVPWGQQSLLDELLEALDSDPNNVEAKRMLIDQYRSLGWEDAAADLTREVEGRPPLPSRKGNGASDAAPPPLPPPYVAMDMGDAGNQGWSVEQLKEGYVALRSEAEALLEEMVIFQQLAPDMDCGQDMADLAALCEGRMFSVARRTVGKGFYSSTETRSLTLTTTGKGKKPVRKPVGTPSTASTAGLRGFGGVPTSVSAVATAARGDPSGALETVINDFKAVVHWQRSSGTTVDDVQVRATLRKRVVALRSALPKELAHLSSNALMHIEHELLKKTYNNTETMLGDPVSDIPRANFWVSEDNYAWDMAELVQAIKASKGSLRNPLTKDPFSVADIEAIIRHPLGKDVAAVQIEQKKLKHGVRPETIKRLKAMAAVLLSDDTENSAPSYAAVDEFLSYVATLPEMERETIDKLKVPAVDSHTRQPFDDTIGDAVRDAKGNRICFHKAGDLVKQAAEFLGKGQ